MGNGLLIVFLCNHRAIPSLPEHHIPDRDALPPDAAISGQELVGILQQEIKHWPADEQQVFELHFLVGFEAGEIGRAHV